MLLVSLLVNVLVLVPVCLGMMREAAWVEGAYGPRNPGRQILLAIYLTIFLVSLVGLLGLSFIPSLRLLTKGNLLGMLLVQIIYKLLSPFTVGTLSNPVVLSNIAIASLHIVTVVSLI